MVQGKRPLLTYTTPQKETGEKLEQNSGKYRKTDLCEIREKTEEVHPSKTDLCISILILLY